MRTHSLIFRNVSILLWLQIAFFTSILQNVGTEKFTAPDPTNFDHEPFTSGNQTFERDTKTRNNYYMAR